MSRQNNLKFLFLTLVLASFATSCGLVEKWKTPEQPTDSKTANADSSKPSETDDLFSKTMNDTKQETALNARTDAPSNINNEAAAKDDLKSLEDEFAGSTSATTAKEVAAAPESKQVKTEEALPEIKEEIAPAIEASNSNAGKMMTYKVSKGETLMQIAFKIYGDIGKWKSLKEMNRTTFSKNSALHANMTLKYAAPNKEFVWNPEGTPYMIKNGETLGTISNSVYKTPKKWKSIWENNKPLIKNPNVIYAGFTLYYKGTTMANYVQPKVIQRKTATAPIIEEKKIVEEVKVEEAISKLNAADNNEIDLTKEVQSAPLRDINDEVKSDEQIDEALTK